MRKLLEKIPLDAIPVISGVLANVICVHVFGGSNAEGFICLLLGFFIGWYITE